MPVERGADHPSFEVGGSRITSFAAPSRGADECILFSIDVPAGGGLPPHRHDHQDVFTLIAGTGTIHIDDEATSIEAGDSVVVPTGALHHVAAGPDGCTMVVTMLAGTKFIRETGETSIPAWGS